ncbi:CopG family transcriptional regulator [Geobacter sulfurreducens]|nr:CopG family transcriptional regulator [Geobacter sulfurreducens]
MAKAKLAVTLDEDTLSEVDRLVARRVFPNRSRIIEEAVKEKLARMTHSRLARECALLDPAFEKALAEEGMGEELNEWPEY